MRSRELAPLANVTEVTFFSLQMGEAAQESASPPPGMTLIDLTSSIADFADTAALISHLDLVITVDTAVAHLAGAMNKATWVLLPFVPDWRWMLERSDSPWYPSVKLFRQATAGEWELVCAARGGGTGGAMPRVTIEQAVQIALQHHQAGRIAEAEKIYREVLNQRPNQADALHLLGVIALQVSRFDDAVDLISRG